MPLFALIIVLCSALSARPDDAYPKPEWRDTPDPLASPHAVQGGTLRFAAFQPPKSLNAYIDSNTYTRQVFGMMYETLLGVDSVTTEFVPYLAKRWTISADKLTYTFEIDPAATWSDGRPVSADDVKWTFDQVMDPKNATGASKVLLGVFATPEVLGPRTVRFRAKESHWRNLSALGLFEIMPKHAFEGQDFNRLDLDRPVVSGPYVLSAVKEQIEIRMSRRRDWWAGQRASLRNTMNFDTVVFRYFTDNENAFEAFKKGQVDVYAIYTARIWANETIGEKFDKNWIVKRRVRNHNPIGFQGFAMNMRRPPFDDLRVRKAFAHLVDRETMNKTMMFSAYFLHRSYFEDLYDAAHPCTNETFRFDIPRAKALLREAGYMPNPQTGILEKAGRPLTFNFLTRDGGSDKFLALCASALKEAGIAMKIDRKDFASWMRDMDAYNFDVTWAAWGGSLFRDPESMWLSKEADRPSGNNLTGYKDPRVDALIEKQKTLFSITERNHICREIDALVASAVPYVLLWNTDVTRLLCWDTFGMPDTVLSKFGDERSLLGYWWYDADSASELKAAMSSGDILPQRTVFVDFDIVSENSKSQTPDL
ncbi:MAG TPA: extracellular solute-binding protein [Kiritimatiellia bacterium]|nr:extracellular solute-binding protein [Kiritimatiellia bacterium]HPS06215.1 extracellular solute-binding protein [Kiritimatiellia bacterium]